MAQLCRVILVTYEHVACAAWTKAHHLSSGGTPPFDAVCNLGEALVKADGGAAGDYRLRDDAVQAIVDECLNGGTQTDDRSAAQYTQAAARHRRTMTGEMTSLGMRVSERIMTVAQFADVPACQYVVSLCGVIRFVDELVRREAARDSKDAPRDIADKALDAVANAIVRLGCLSRRRSTGHERSVSLTVVADAAAEVGWTDEWWAPATVDETASIAYATQVVDFVARLVGTRESGLAFDIIDPCPLASCRQWVPGAFQAHDPLMVTSDDVVPAGRLDIGAPAPSGEDPSGEVGRAPVGERLRTFVVSIIEGVCSRVESAQQQQSNGNNGDDIKCEGPHQCRVGLDVAVLDRLRELQHPVDLPNGVVQRPPATRVASVASPHIVAWWQGPPVVQSSLVAALEEAIGPLTTIRVGQKGGGATGTKVTLHVAYMAFLNIELAHAAVAQSPLQLVVTPRNGDTAVGDVMVSGDDGAVQITMCARPYPIDVGTGVSMEVLMPTHVQHRELKKREMDVLYDWFVQLSRDNLLAARDLLYLYPPLLSALHKIATVKHEQLQMLQQQQSQQDLGDDAVRGQAVAVGGGD